MSDQFDTQQLEEEIKRRYPYPLAATFHRAYGSAGDDDESHDYLLDLFEVALKYCASIALSQYFTDAHSDPKISRDLLALQRPSLGHWQGWLRDILSFYRREGRQLLIPELDAFYTYRDTGPLLHAYSSLRKLMVDRMQYGGGRNLGVATPRDFFELVGDYRNRLAHGARPSRPDRERVAHIMAPAVLHLLGMMRPLADYPLVYVSDVRLWPGSTPQKPYYNHHYTNLTGDRHYTSRQPKRIDHIAAYPKQLYLLAKEDDFQPILSLHPFFIFRHCESCNQEQAFVLNESRERTLDYVSYQCTHHFSPTEYLDYMQSLIGNLTVTPEEEARLEHEEAERLELERAAQQVREQAAQQAREERERLVQEEVARLAREQEERQAKEQAELQARQAAERQPKEDAVRREEEQRQEQLRLEQERLAQGEAQRQREKQEDRTHEETQRRVQEEQIASPNADRQAAQIVEQVPSPVIPYYVAPPVTRKSRRTILWVSIVSILLLSGISATVILSIRPDERDSAQATATAKALAVRTETAVPKSTVTAIARVPTTAAVQSGLLDTLAGDTGDVISVAFSPDGRLLASGSLDKTTKLWRVVDGTKIRTLAGHIYPVHSVAFSPDGTLLASGSSDSTIKLWRVVDGTETHTLAGHTDQVFSVAFSPNGGILASGSVEDTIKLWRVVDGTEIRTLTGDTGDVNSIAFSPDGTLLASGTAFKTIKLWRVVDGTEVSALTGHTSDVKSVAFSPDGTLLASGSSDSTIKLWRVVDGTETQTLVGHTDQVRSVAFSPDGGILASGSSDSTIKLWRVVDGTEIRTFTGHTNLVLSVAFSPDGTLLASGSSDGTIKLWKVP